MCSLQNKLQAIDQSKRKWRSFLKWMLLPITFTLALLLIGYGYGFRINTTPSMPLGLWRIKPVTQSLKKGDIILFCPPDNKVFQMAKARHYISGGTCHSDYEPLLKPIVAVSGDRITLSERGVFVNGVMIKNSKYLSRDDRGRDMPKIETGAVIMREGDIFVVSSYNEASFDSRYFRKISRKNVIGIAHKVI